MATSSDEKLLEEIRETWELDDREWADVRDEGAKDIQCLTGGLWDAMDPDGVTQRKKAKRPIITLDELSQYCNQVINDLRQNKRGIKVTPTGNGANDQTALFRQGKIRDIEYRSNSHQAYTTMAENAIQRSYGFLRIKAEWIGDGFEQELLIEPVVNPDTVTPDCYSVRSDGKDLRRIWVRETRPTNEFIREFPKASVTDFAGAMNSLSNTHRSLAGKWIHGTSVDIAEFWHRKLVGSRTRIALKPADPSHPPDQVWEDELKGLTIPSEQIIRKREVDQFEVCQYLTNGMEILKRTVWKGQSIPFVCCYGKVVYVRQGTETKRKILSLVRLARDPQMLMAYLASSQAEIVGMTTKVPYFHMDGSLSAEALNLIAKSLYEPVASIPVQMPKNAPPGAGYPPFPIRNPWEPFLQQLEVFKESVRRSIQAAIGASPLPTQAQRHNEKSGVALKQIEDTAQKGSFHFVDHYDEGIARTGTLLNDAIPYYYDTARDTSIRKPDDSVAMVRINDPQAKYSPKLEKGDDPQYAHIQTNVGDHDVTISVGPRQDSEREASSDFADTVIGSKIIEMVGPQKGPKLIAAAIRLKNLGPVGDEMADIIDPKPTGQQDPNQAAQLKGENDHLKQQLQGAAKVIETDQIKTQGQITIKKMDLDFQREKLTKELASKIEIARITASKQTADMIAESQEENLALGVELGHEALENAKDRSHDLNIAAQAHAHAIQQGAQAHDQALEQGAQGVAGTLASQQQAADLAPQPEAGA